MIYIETNSVNEVVMIHMLPFDENVGLGKSETELNKTGFLVNSLPNIEDHFGKVSVLKGDKVSRTVWYEYVDRPLNKDEEFINLKDQMTLLQQAMDDLIMSGGAL